MTKPKRALLVAALGPLTLMGLSVHALANTEDDGLSGDWKGTCTKVGTGATWDIEIMIHEDGTYRWTSTFPATSDNPGWTAGHTGRVDRPSGQLIENEPDNGKIIAHYSVDGSTMHVDPENGMSQCALTR